MTDENNSVHELSLFDMIEEAEPIKINMFQ